MAASPYSIDPTTYLDELLAQASPDLMREMLQGFINQILSTQADQICGADYATTSKSRTNVRNGYRHRDLDTRVGTIDVAVPKLRTGPDPRKVDTSGASYAALVSIAEVSVS
ncbi:transposase, partial [Corynebacterium accolens]|uniref:transposase n=1 Tax=Corynebacterium accolens TaxID=38284 RepID=UPI00254332AD